MTSHRSAEVLATYSRSGFVEGAHLGHAVVVDPAGVVTHAWGDPQTVIFPRSSNKPAQATAMVEAGLDLPERLLALASSSHSGEPFHLEAVAEILILAGLSVSDLRTPPDYPLDEVERDAWVRAGRDAEPLGMNCSGKHAAMLLVCVSNGWPTDSYPDPAHPLQVAIRATLERLAGERVAHVGIDGCGAPVMSLTLAGLARSLSRSVQAPRGAPERRVVAAMSRHPEYVGGTRRDVTALMRAIPGLVAKDGAEGVYVAALPDGTGIALKVDDGADRARQVAMAGILRRLGQGGSRLAALATVPITGGGVPVGEVTSPLV